MRQRPSHLFDYNPDKLTPEECALFDYFVKHFFFSQKEFEQDQKEGAHSGYGGSPISRNGAEGQQSLVDLIPEMEKTWLFCTTDSLGHCFGAFNNYAHLNHNTRIKAKHITGARLGSMQDASQVNDIPELVLCNSKKLPSLFKKYTTRSMRLNDVIEGVRDCIEDSRSTEKAKATALAIFDEAEPRIRRICKFMPILRNQHFFEQWAAGEFTYKQPLFQDPHAMNDLMHVMKMILLDTRFELSDQNAAAIERLKERVMAHEAVLLEKEAADRKRQEARLQEDRELQEKTRRARAEHEIRAAEERALKRAQEETLRLSTPQPYAIGNSDVTNRVEDLARGTGYNKKSAQAMLDLMEEAALTLDTNKPGISELGHLLLSATNQAALAKSLGMASSLRGIEPGRTTGSDLNTLRTLYEHYPEVHTAVDNLLNNDSGILLLATLTRLPPRCQQYGTFVQNALAKRNQLETDLAPVNASLSGLNPDEWAGDDDYQKLYGEKTRLESELAALKIDEARAALAAEIRQAFQGRRIKFIENSPVPEFSAADSNPENIQLSAYQQKVMGGEFGIENAEDGKLIVRHLEFPHLHKSVTPPLYDAQFGREIEALRIESGQHRKVLALIEKLKESGFTLETENGKSRFIHPEYEITAALTGTPAAQHSALLTAQNLLEQSRFAQQSALDVAMGEGFILTREGSGALTLRHEKLPEITLAPRGFMDRIDHLKLGNAISNLRSISTHAPMPEEEEPQETQNTTWQPASNTHGVLLDAGIAMLAAPRGKEGRTWLDLVKATARLPDTQVIIPAVVEWEMIGRAQSHDAEGKITLEPLDDRIPYASHPFTKVQKNLANFLSSASRAWLNGDGTVHFVPGRNRNIIIWETREDQALFNRVRDIQNLKNRDEREHRMKSEIFGHGEGEKAIERVIREIPFPLCLTVISEDGGYLRSPDTQSTSPHGMPVAHSSIGCYMDAELRARGHALQGMLDEPEFISINRISQDVNEHLSELRADNSHYFAPHSQPGTATVPINGSPRNIYEVIQRGWAARNGKPAAKVENIQEVAVSNGAQKTEVS